RAGHRCARHSAQEALRVGRNGTRRRHRDSGRSPRCHRRGIDQTGLARQESRRLSAVDRVSCAHRDKSCLESAHLIDGPPKAQPPGNAQAQELQSLAISGERSRRSGGSTEGEQRASALDLSGSRTEGREVAMGLRTPLYDTHVSQGAKIVDFGGWDLPLSFGSQLEEHHAVRRDAGMFDVSHMCVIDLTGARGREFLRRLLANDVGRLRIPGQALYSCMLLPSGGVIDDLIVYFMTESWFRLVVNAGTRNKDLAWIREHAAAFGVAVSERTDLAMLAVQGPRAIAKTLPLLSASHRTRALEIARFSGAALDSWFVARTGYTGEDGFEIMLPAQEAPDTWRALLAQGVTAAG